MLSDTINFVKNLHFLSATAQEGVWQLFTPINHFLRACGKNLPESAVEGKINGTYTARHMPGF